jgi:hypothetical protein
MTGHFMMIYDDELQYKVSKQQSCFRCDQTTCELNSVDKIFNEHKSSASCQLFEAVMG